MQLDVLLRSGERILERLGGVGYWGSLQQSYPSEFAKEWGLSGLQHVLIGERYGGGGMQPQVAGELLRMVNRMGGNSACVHAFYYLTSILERATSERQREEWLPRFTQNEWTLQSMGVTENQSGSDTLSLKTYAKGVGSGQFTLHGDKMWTSRALFSTHMIVLARMAPFTRRTSDDLALFLVNLEEERRKGTVVVTPVPTMINHNTTSIMFDGTSAELLGAAQPMHWRHLLSALNVERCLIAAECLGDCEFFLNRATEYAKNRIVFGKSLSENQGISFPLARGFAQYKAAEALVQVALGDETSRTACNVAKLVASEASWFLAETAMMIHGGNGFACGDIERKWKEARLFLTAPISTNLILEGLAKTELFHKKQ